MRALLLILAGLALLGVPAARGAGMLNRSTTGDGVTVALSSPLADLTPGGCVPYQVEIRNDRNAPGTWHLSFQAAASSSALGAMYFEQPLTVPPNATGRFEVYVPMPVASERANTSLTIGVRGPGFDSSGFYRQFFAFIYSNNTGTRLPFALLGENLLGAPGVGPLESLYKDRGLVFYGGAAPVDALPVDWRGYSGVGKVLLRDGEWLALDPAQRQALCDYVAQGGGLTLFTSADDPATRIPQLQLPTPDGAPGAYGFGVLSVESTPAFPPDAATVASSIESNHAAAAETTDLQFASWGLRGRVGSITLHSGFIVSFVVLFGVLIGPVNLFLFARGRNRFRLFWTTPAISILASVALIAGILLTDGLGGEGRQFLVVYSLPAIHREAVLQEQIARTAVLFSSRWHSDQDYVITPVSQRAFDNASEEPGYRAYSPHASLASSPDTFVQIGSDYSGAWFRSRSVCGQYLQAMRPSRSALTVLNPNALARGEAPVVLSSFPQELARLYVIDAQGRPWTSDHVLPGQRATCTAAQPTDFRQFWTSACSDAGGRLQPLLDRAFNRPGCFYAVGPPAAGQALATLGEIHWGPAQGLYLGPWVAAAAGGEGTP